VNIVLRERRRALIPRSKAIASPVRRVRAVPRRD
jgi:hypothetical protein